jgi:hypothetical protein
MEQNHRWAGTGAQVSHARAIEIHPAFFDACPHQGAAARRNSRTSLIAKSGIANKIFLLLGQLFQ